MARAATENIGGLQLAVDRKLLQSPSVVAGKNFIVEVEGPRSAFAYEQMYRILPHANFCTSVRYGSRFFYFAFDDTQSNVLIFYMNWPERQWSLIFEGVSDTAFWTYPMSSAKVGGKYYFAHRGFGIFEYDPSTDNGIDVTADFPTNTFYVTEAGGRCIALSEGYVSQSAIDDGNDFVPSPTTGAGAQSLSLVGMPDKDSEYLGLKPTADGFLVFVEQGVLKGTIIDSPLVFRYTVVVDGKIPVSPLCIAQLSKSAIVVLAKDGLYTTDGRQFQPWQPLMGEYLKSSVLPRISDAVAGQIQLHYAKAKEWFFVSYTFTQNFGLYEQAFVSYLPRDEWGSFNTLHRGFIEVDTFDDGSVIDLAFISDAGRISKFEDQTSNLVTIEDVATNPSDLQSARFYSDKVIDAISFLFGGVAIVNTNSRGSSDWLVHDTMTVEQNAWPTYPAVYELWGLKDTRTDDAVANPTDAITDESGSPVLVNTQSHYSRSELLVYGFIRQQPKRTSLNCHLTLGSFRYTDGQAHDQISLASGLSISMVDSASSLALVSDWLLEPTPDIITDWMDGATDTIIDWGYALGSSVQYTCTLKGTLDAYAVWEDQEEVITPFLIDGTTQFFSPKISGLYILVELDGSAVGDYLHLKHAEINGILAGRL